MLGIALIGVVATLGVQAIDPNSSGATIFGINTSNFSKNSLGYLISAIVFLYVFKAITSLVLLKALTSNLAKVDSYVAQQITNYFVTKDFSRIRKLDKSKLQWFINDSVTHGFSMVFTNVSAIVSDGSVLLLVSILFFIADPVASLFVISYFLIIGVLIQRIASKLQSKAADLWGVNYRETITRIEDSVVAFKEAHVLSKNLYLANKVNAPRSKMAHSTGKITFYNGLPRQIAEVSLMLGVLSFVGWQFISGPIGQGAAIIGVFLAGGVRIMGALVPVQNSITSLRVATEIGSDSRKYLELSLADTEKDLIDANIEKNWKIPASLTKVNFAYSDSESNHLSDVDLVINEGQFVAIIGPSGAGKTTLVDVILGLLKPQSGTVSIFGESSDVLFGKPPTNVAYVPQKPGIIHGTIAENVALGFDLEDIDFGKVWDCLIAAQLDDIVLGFPNQIETRIDSGTAGLSGGQIQRLGLARALYGEPRLIVLDEATSGLDAVSESIVYQSLMKLRPKSTVVVIAHRLSTVQNADKVILVENGQITASDTFENLRKNVPLVEEYVRLMSFDEI